MNTLQRSLTHTDITLKYNPPPRLRFHGTPHWPIPRPRHPATAPAPARTALNPSLACSRYPIAAGELLRPLLSLSPPAMEGGRAMSLAVAMAGVVVVDAAGGGEVSRVGLSGGEGAKISLGGGGDTRI